MADGDAEDFKIPRSGHTTLEGFVRQLAKEWNIELSEDTYGEPNNPCFYLNGKDSKKNFLAYIGIPSQEVLDAKHFKFEKSIPQLFPDSTPNSENAIIFKDYSRIIMTFMQDGTRRVGIEVRDIMTALLNTRLEYGSSGKPDFEDAKVLLDFKGASQTGPLKDMEIAFNFVRGYLILSRTI